MNNEIISDYYIQKYYELLAYELDYINAFYSPYINIFKKVYKRHTNFAVENYEYPLEKIHIMKPKIFINKKQLFDTKTKYYILMIQKLYKISETESIKKLKMFDGNVYETILYG